MENKQLTLGSLFDGSGGFPLGGLLTGQITPVWSSEIEPFAIRVTTKRLPQVKHYGDVSTISGADLPPVDIITFGSPCQDMSIAGKFQKNSVFKAFFERWVELRVWFLSRYLGSATADDFIIRTFSITAMPEQAEQMSLDEETDAME